MTDNDPAQAPDPIRPPGKTAGKWMLFIAWGLGMVLLTLFFGQWIEERQNPNRSPDSYSSGNIQEVRLNRNFYGHYVVSGKINGKSVTFLLDTGATDVVIPESTANALGLPKGLATRASTANGIITVFKSLIPSLEIGNIRLNDVRASINPAMGRSDDILLGMSALQHLDIIQEDNVLILRHYL